MRENLATCGNQMALAFSTKRTHSIVREHILCYTPNPKNLATCGNQMALAFRASVFGGWGVAENVFSYYRMCSLSRECNQMALAFRLHG